MESPDVGEPEAEDSSLRILSAYHRTSEAHYSATSLNHFTGYRSPRRPFLNAASPYYYLPYPLAHRKGEPPGVTWAERAYVLVRARNIRAGFTADKTRLTWEFFARTERDTRDGGGGGRLVIIPPYLSFTTEFLCSPEIIFVRGLHTHPYEIYVCRRSFARSKIRACQRVIMRSDRYTVSRSR